MVTLTQLKRQIQAERDKVDRAREKQRIEAEKISLKKQLKILQRSPGTQRNIALAKRTATGFKRLAGIGGRALIKQARLIKEQQLREDALFKREGKSLAKRAKKKLRKTNRVITKKLKRKRR